VVVVEEDEEEEEEEEEGNAAAGWGRCIAIVSLPGLVTIILFISYLLLLHLI